MSRYLSGTIDLHSNPAAEERITEAGWFSQEELPEGHVFPAALRDDFWRQLPNGFPTPVKLPLLKSIF